MYTALNIQNNPYSHYSNAKGTVHPHAVSYFIFLFFTYNLFVHLISIRFMNNVWIASNGITPENINSTATRLKLVSFRTKVFLICLLHFFLDQFYMPCSPVSIVLLAGVPALQILHNLKFQAYRFSARFNLYYFLPRVMIYVYYRLVPGNLKNLRPMPRIVFGSLSLFLFLIWVLYRQSVKGVWWFVPVFLRKKEFDYLVPRLGVRETLHSKKRSNSLLSFFTKLFRKVRMLFSKDQVAREFSKESLDVVNTRYSEDYGQIKQSDTSVSEDTSIQDVEIPQETSETDQLSDSICSICLNSVFGEVDEDNEDDSASDFSVQIFKEYSEKYRKDFVMKTPCGHMFHIGKRWLIGRMSLEVDGT